MALGFFDLNSLPFQSKPVPGPRLVEMSEENGRAVVSPVLELSFLPALYIGAEPGRAKEESRITCMRMFRTPPF